MGLRNREGVEVDPVPFAVTACMAFLLLFSFAPGYLLTLGVSVRFAVGVTTVAFLAMTATAYHQMVYTANPARTEEVPASVRFRRLMYVVLVGIAITLLLLLPVVLR